MRPDGAINISRITFAAKKTLAGRATSPMPRAPAKNTGISGVSENCITVMIVNGSTYDAPRPSNTSTAHSDAAHSMIVMKVSRYQRFCFHSKPG